MPERIEKLKAIIAELEAELQSLDSLDDQSRQVLENAVEELHATLSRQPPDTAQRDSIRQRLEAAEQRYQINNPTLSGIVLRVIDALGQLGI